jgi:predicted DNA binding protein
MQIIDVKLRVRHESAMCNLSKDHPGAHLLLWCNGTSDVLQMAVKEPEALEDVLESLKKTVHIQELIKENNSALTMVRSCACDGTYLAGIVEDCGCLSIGPQTYSEGWEFVRLFAPTQSSLKVCVAKLKLYGQVEVMSMKVRNESGALQEMGIAPVPFFGGLTEKQIEVLVSAYEFGLLNVPAKTKMDVVAKKVGVSRSTYGEHLRKAMQTLVENSYPVLKLYASSYTKPSSEDQTP